MARVRAEALVGGAEGLLSRPGRVVARDRLGEPGDTVPAGADVAPLATAWGTAGATARRLVAVEEVPLAHLGLDPDERERFGHRIGEARTVFVHYVE